MTYGSWNHQYVYECYFQNNSGYTEVQIYLSSQMSKEQQHNNNANSWLTPVFTLLNLDISVNARQ